MENNNKTGKFIKIVNTITAVGSAILVVLSIVVVVQQLNLTKKLKDAAEVAKTKILAKMPKKKQNNPYIENWGSEDWNESDYCDQDFFDEDIAK